MSGRATSDLTGDFCCPGGGVGLTGDVKNDKQAQRAASSARVMVLVSLRPAGWMFLKWMGRFFSASARTGPGKEKREIDLFVQGGRVLDHSVNEV